MEKEITPWHVAYNLIAKLLYGYYVAHGNAAGQFLFPHLIQNKDFKILNHWTKAFDEAWANNSVDPIQLFASISGSNAKDETRRNRINRLIKLLDTKSPQFAEIDFSGCPSPPPIRLQAVREYSFQQEIWDSFGRIYNEKQQGLEEQDWVRVRRWFGVGYPSFTIFLFWIASDSFLPLDGNTIAFLSKYQRLPEQPFEFPNFQTLIKKIAAAQVEKTESLFRQITEFSKVDVEEGKGIRAFPDLLRSYLGAATSPLPAGSFKLVAIETFSNLPNDIGRELHLKPLKGNLIYPFDQAFEFVENAEEESIQIVRFVQKKALAFFKAKTPEGELENQLQVNVHALVGKNGSGKSTIVELFMKVIYQILVSDPRWHGHKKYNSFDDLHIALYYHDAGGLKKIKIHEDEIQFGIFHFRADESQFDLPNSELKKATWELLQPFFYSMVVNYSLYAFQDTEGDNAWLNRIFYKNDAYQAPIVITPMRENGNIDMPQENKFAVSRLLGILFFSDEKILGKSSSSGRESESIRNLTDKETAVQVDYTLGTIGAWKPKPSDKEKVWCQLYERMRKTSKSKLLQNIYLQFGGEVNWFDDWKNPEQISSEKQYDRATLIAITDYLVRKTLKMADYYRNIFPGHIDNEKKEFRTIGKGGKTIATRIFEDKSHITTKFRQAINFLRFGVWRDRIRGFEEFSLKIEEEAEYLNQVAINRLSTEYKEEFTPEELLPPPVFHAKIKLEKTTKENSLEGNTQKLSQGLIDFESLSSGEKQRIYTVGTIIYHLRNLDSVGKQTNDASATKTHRNLKSLISYPNVNLVLDEIELYYHPDYQRKFLAYLLSMLGRVRFGNLRSLNILFVTHSPYILSDIPHTVVLKLNDNGKPDHRELKTLAANIHDLLKDSFFMNDGMIGEYAKSQLKSLITYMEYRIGSKKPPKDSADTELVDHEHLIVEEWSPERSKKVIDLIGEPLIQQELLRMYDLAFAKELGVEAARLRIAELASEIEKIKVENGINETEI